MNMTMNKNEAAVRGFTLIELLVVISIIGLLVALIFPTFETMKDQGRIVICKTNLQSLFHGFKAYAQDYQDKIAMNGGGGSAGNYDGHLGKFWVNGYLTPAVGSNCITGITTGAIYPYINDIRPYKCPSMPKNTTKDDYYRSYEMSDCLGPSSKGSTCLYLGIINEDTKSTTFLRAETFSQLARPSKTMMLVECNSRGDDGYYAKSGQTASSGNIAALYHVGPPGNTTWSKSPVLFCDGHVELLNKIAIDMAYEAFYHEPPAEVSPTTGTGS